MHGRGPHTIVVAITLGACLALSTSVGLGEAFSAQSTTISVTGHLHAIPDVVPDTTLCQAEGGVYAVGPSDAPESGTSTITGTFNGTGRFCGHTLRRIGPGGSLPFIETDTFTGTVRGCGKGTVTYHVNGVVRTRPHPATLGLPTDETWQIAAHSGTAGLHSLTSGHGHDVGQINADSSIDTDFRGSVTCTRR
jgi:hypothetical protein